MLVAAHKRKAQTTSKETRPETDKAPTQTDIAMAPSHFWVPQNDFRVTLDHFVVKQNDFRVTPDHFLVTQIYSWLPPDHFPVTQNHFPLTPDDFLARKQAECTLVSGITYSSYVGWARFMCPRDRP